MKSYVTPLIIALSIITGVFVLGNAYKYKFKTQETISVTGLAETNFVSDQIVWTGNYSRKTMDLRSAYSQLKEDESKIRAYLKGKGVSEAEMVFSAISDKEFSSRYVVDAVNLRIQPETECNSGFKDIEKVKDHNRTDRERDRI
jgi:hypothetical protein